MHQELKAQLEADRTVALARYGQPVSVVIVQPDGSTKEMQCAAADNFAATFDKAIELLK